MTGAAARPNVFVSYARADRDRAEALAAALESLGCEVWWDRHIAGGSAFAQEIEAALERADIVAVLWSPASIQSNWVRDEASVGRDSGRLLPFRLDRAQPPLGFRQTQAIDLSRWDGTAADPALVAALRAALDRRRRGGAPARPGLPPPTVATDLGRRPRGALAAGAAALALALAAGGVLLWRTGDMAEPAERAAAAGPPVVAVLPFLDRSGSSGSRIFAEGVAEDILDRLAQDRRVRVLGRTSAAMLAERPAEIADRAQALGISHLLEGSVRSASGRFEVSVRLVKLPEGVTVLADEFETATGDLVTVQDEIGDAVATRLAGAIAPRSSAPAERPHTTAPVYSRFVAARQLIRSRQPDDLKRAEGLLLEAVRADPRYAPAYAALAEASVLLASNQYGDRPPDASALAAKGYAARALDLAPSLADAHAASGMAAAQAGERDAAIAAFRKAVALEPAQVDYLSWLGWALNEGGYVGAAAEAAERAVSLEPLWFKPRLAAIWSLARAGDYAKIEALAASYQPIAPTPTDAARVRLDAHYELSQVPQAVSTARQLLAADPADDQALGVIHIAGLLLMRPDLVREGGGAGSLEESYAAMDYAAAARRAAELGPAVWDDRFAAYNAVMARLMARDWTGLLRDFGARYPMPDAFFSDAAYVGRPDIAVAIATAMDMAGDPASARRMRMLAQREVEGWVRSGGSPDQTTVALAQISALDGRRGEAARLLMRGALRSPSKVCGASPLDRVPALEPLEAEPDFRAAVARCRDWVRATSAKVPARAGR